MRNIITSNLKSHIFHLVLLMRFLPFFSWIINFIKLIIFEVKYIYNLPRLAHIGYMFTTAVYIIIYILLLIAAKLYGFGVDIIYFFSNNFDAIVYNFNVIYIFENEGVFTDSTVLASNVDASNTGGNSLNPDSAGTENSFGTGGNGNGNVDPFAWAPPDSADVPKHVLLAKIENQNWLYVDSIRDDFDSNNFPSHPRDRNIYSQYWNPDSRLNQADTNLLHRTFQNNPNYALRNHNSSAGPILKKVTNGGGMGRTTYTDIKPTNVFLDELKRNLGIN